MSSTDLSEVCLQQLNTLPQSVVADFFANICHCQRWAEEMAASRPYDSVESVLQKAREAWHDATEAEVLEAFQGHARIGDMNALKQKYSAASKEQGQVAEADDNVIQALFDENEAYFDKNGFIFIVCATGKSAEEMLVLLRQRLPNPRALEVANGAMEQAKITEIRIHQRVTLD
ncbi:2-oxo-4-hydroxy-4-carboxy-5-ureidoimidazoline decarboxylase [Marinibactrum halimedae]|uniref:2-oxo-4-hydroxy-4-carboxy-5-ureidoimidazoline decarboxylase n=1 Tax=Marinibactrum halimedae TaxID=1444977 RepID=A0AA37T6P1_9GAMM|nr:2-oxo-4-hydroxy-4-carboxy-5-ureidoimidazoline decarboxylase [Marinibactrum halimedae]MCD9459671.1 2-oxo-4-hydroxy-4-carboxy-5-ureidoimidazoline decarboxylase [Marinibactrum halimedae]GLS25697.1 2-oxo-4-hydroxy-4-carboxy-5-ureidoimidazoline decarboxylase [Marinibactrum halimedae]